MSWNDERSALLTKLWGDGLSASQIAARLGGVSRSAVIGKVHRLGLSGRATRNTNYNRPRAKPKPKTSNLPGRPPKPRVSASAAALAALGDVKPETIVSVYEELVIPADQRKTIETLDECDCRWPIGDPQKAEFHFCGKAKIVGLPYCEFHVRRAFQPPRPPGRPAMGVNLARRPLQIASGHMDGQETQTAAGDASERETEDA